MLSPLQAAGLAGIAPLAIRAAGNLFDGLPFLSHLGEAQENQAPSSTIPTLELEQVEADFDRLLDDLGRFVRSRLSDAGVANPDNIEISVGSDGRLAVQVSGNASSSIESLLTSDAEVIARVNALAAEHQLLTAAQRHLRFAEQYAQGKVETANLSPTSDAGPFKIRVDANNVAVISNES